MAQCNLGLFLRKKKKHGFERRVDLLTGRAYYMHLAPKKAPNKQDCVYRKGKKSDILDENLLSPTNKVSKKFRCDFMV